MSMSEQSSNEPQPIDERHARPRAPARLTFVRGLSGPLTAIGNFLDAAGRLEEPDSPLARMKLVEALDNSRTQIARADDIMRYAAPEITYLATGESRLSKERWRGGRSSLGRDARSRAGRANWRDSSASLARGGRLAGGIADVGSWHQAAVVGYAFEGSSATSPRPGRSLGKTRPD